MAKEKIYKLAKEFNVSSEAMVQMLKGMGIPVKSHMSTVDESLRDQIKAKFEQERAAIKKQYQTRKRTVTRKAPPKETTQSTESTSEKSSTPKEKSTQEKSGDFVKKYQRRRTIRQRRPEGQEEATTATNNDNSQEEKRAASSRIRERRNPRAEQGRSFNQDNRRPEGRDRGEGQGGRPPHRGGDRPERANRGNIDDQKQQRKFSPPTPQGDVNEIVAPPDKPDTRKHKAIPNKGKKGTEGTTDSKFADKKKKPHGKKGKKVAQYSDADIKKTIKATITHINSGSAKKKYAKAKDVKENEEFGEKKTLSVSEFVTVSELANMMELRVNEVITKCLELGLFVTINQRLDFETIELVADEFDFEAKLMDEYSAENEEAEDENLERVLEPRAPVVTIMGHVDHGKTSVLDYIRATNVIAGEAGGITQHIAAYEVKTQHGSVTFLDTPGHEAFTAMRARGSQATDVVVLIVAADSAVMNQTKEAIDHAKAANVPIVVAINKVDLPTANVDKIKGELAQYNILVSDYGGQISCVEVSAKTGQGMDKLLEVLALETEILELQAAKNVPARGVVVESELDKGKGAIATILVQEGVLKKGDPFVTGIHHGRVRELFNERGVPVPSAGPSQPVVVLGLSGTPQAGDSFRVAAHEKEAREISGKRRLAQKERELRKLNSVSLDHLYEAIQEGSIQSLNLILKGDVDGSVEALASSLEKLSTPEIKVNVLHKSVGAIKETDIHLARASKAIIIGFHINPNSKIKEIAKQEGVDIRLYRIIYEAVDEMHDAMEGMLSPEIKEEVIGSIEIREVFKVSKLGNIAGCMVTSGVIKRKALARLIRDDVEILESKITTLKRFQEDAKEVRKGFECGLTFEVNADFQVGDRIEVYEKVEVARKLSR